MTLEDMVVPVAKIRMIADLFDIENHGAQHEFGYVEIPGQSLVGSSTILEEVAAEIDSIYRAECKCWRKEREQFMKTIDGLNEKIAILQGGDTHV